jgi:hypothetical protein
MTTDITFQRLPRACFALDRQPRVLGLPDRGLTVLLVFNQIAPRSR